MAITQDATSSSGPTTGTSATVSHTCSGTNRLLLVGILTVGTTSDIVTGVTYNSVAMTRVNTQVVGTDVVRGYFYYLINPATGANNVVVSTSTSADIYTRNVSFTGAKQSGQPDASHVGNTSGVSPLSDTLTTVDDNSVHYTLFFVNTSAETAGTNTVAILGNGNNLYRYNPLLITPAGSNSTQVTWTGSQQVGFVGVSLSPAAGAAAVSNLALLGVG